MRRRSDSILILLFVGTLLVAATCRADEAQPLCRIAAVSTPYITALSAEELGPKRGFLAQTGPPGLERALAAVEALRPDALVVMGSLTWTGSDADFRRLKTFLDRVRVPLFLLPGPQDIADGGLERFRNVFPRQPALPASTTLGGVRLQFASAPQESGGETELVEWLERDLANAGDARGVLLFGGPDYKAPPREKPASAPAVARRYWETIERHGVAVRLVPGHAHTVTAEGTLPIWTVPSSAWTGTPDWTLALIEVYPERIELILLKEDGQPPQTLTVPNPIAAPRLTHPADDPWRLPTYTEDLAQKPELTFIQVSDSQFDDGTVPGYERYQFDEPMNELAVAQVNRLKPAMVFMTGDLTNKNTETEWNTFTRIYSRLEPPFYPVPGNHDTLYDRSRLNREALGRLLETGQANWKLAEKLAGKREPSRVELFRHFTGREPYFAVEKNGCVFLCLYTGVAEVDPEQMKWLRRELERTKSARHVFVLGHYPLLAEFGGNIQGPEAQEILLLLKEYKVAAYLSGHRHRYDYRMHEGTAHILCDCLCWGEYLSYQIYHVHPDRIVACWKPIFRSDGTRPLYERVIFPEPRYDGP
ncbi:MAG: metallophosphoesterase [Planctomycetes bacterium]|nr:metallophosphoesterase [Planctomycetota bacterium]